MLAPSPSLRSTSGVRGARYRSRYARSPGARPRFALLRADLARCSRLRLSRALRDVGAHARPRVRGTPRLRQRSVAQRGPRPRRASARAQREKPRSARRAWLLSVQARSSAHALAPPHLLHPRPFLRKLKLFDAIRGIRKRGHDVCSDGVLACQHQTRPHRGQVPRNGLHIRACDSHLDHRQI